MKFKIGFAGETRGETSEEFTVSASPRTIAPRKSVVQVQFPGRGSALAYYNDRFDLHLGDFVYVDGKLEGLRGRVINVSYNFKIKLSDYKRVIALVDTDVKGQFHYAGSHFITFDRCAIPAKKVARWFMPPAKEEDDLVIGIDDTAFRLDDLKSMKISSDAAERGHEYYLENKVLYLSMDGTHGYAIIEGSKPYEVEFTYHRGEISELTCFCFCGNHCKHQFAAMLQLRETLERIGADYAGEYERTDYFAAIFKGTLFSFAVDGKACGSFTLN